ncbi:hypothetical protein HDU82_001830, partial [Entophlyctis luteolus]
RTGIVWIAQAANSSNSKIPAGVRIGKEIIDVLNGTSSVLQKRLQVHKTALLNRSNMCEEALAVDVPVYSVKG